MTAEEDQSLRDQYDRSDITDPAQSSRTSSASLTVEDRQWRRPCDVLKGVEISMGQIAAFEKFAEHGDFRPGSSL